MDINVAAGGPIIIRDLPARPGGNGSPREVLFGRLTMADLAELIAYIPGDNRFTTIFELNRFASTINGCDQVLLLSLKRLRPEVTLQEVKDLGSLLQRAELAGVIMGQCLTSGEDEVLVEEAKKNAGKPPGPGTGPANQS